MSDMEFVKNFTPPDFQTKNFTLSISPNFNSFGKKKTQKMSENREIYTAGKNFTPPGVTAVTNLTSDSWILGFFGFLLENMQEFFDSCILRPPAGKMCMNSLIL